MHFKEQEFDLLNSTRAKTSYLSKETNNQTKVLKSLEEKVTQLHKKNKELKAKKQKFPDQEEQISNFE